MPVVTRARQIKRLLCKWRRQEMHWLQGGRRNAGWPAKAPCPLPSLPASKTTPRPRYLRHSQALTGVEPSWLRLFSPFAPFFCYMFQPRDCVIFVIATLTLPFPLRRSLPVRLPFLHAGCADSTIFKSPRYYLELSLSIPAASR